MNEVIRALEPPQPWKEHAACRGSDVDLFFPRRGAVEGSIAKARLVCAGCPVQTECLEYALEYDLPGVWGGTTRAQRKTIRRRRAA